MNREDLKNKIAQWSYIITKLNDDIHKFEIEIDEWENKKYKGGRWFTVKEKEKLICEAISILEEKREIAEEQLENAEEVRKTARKNLESLENQSLNTPISVPDINIINYNER